MNYRTFGRYAEFTQDNISAFTKLHDFFKTWNPSLIIQKHQIIFGKNLTEDEMGIVYTCG